MFARLFAVATLVAFVVASPLVARGGQCNTGPIQCCNNVMPASEANNTLGKLGMVGILDGVTGKVGFGCSPSALGNGADCTQQAACCSGSTFYGLIAEGCSPINIHA